MISVKDQILPLTSMRFFAAWAVFFYHVSYFTMGTDYSTALAYFFTYGYAGVSFFFILSGFILTHNYLERFRELDCKAVRSFYITRFARIYPTYILFFAASLPLMMEVFQQSPSKTLIKAACHAFALQSFVPSNTISQTFNPPAWSISDEFFFYAMLPFILYFLSFLKWFGARMWCITAVMIWFLSCAVAFIFKDSQLANWFLYFFPPFRLFDFVLGTVIYFIYLHTKDFNIINSRLRFTLLEIFSLTLLAATFTYCHRIDKPYLWTVVFTPSMGFVIYVHSFSKGFVSKFLSNNFLVFLGHISYVFYMCHVLVLLYTKTWWPEMFTQSPEIITIGALGLSLGISCICYKWYEIPVKQWIKERFA